MTDRAQLLADLQTLVRKLETDLQEWVNAPEVPEVGEKLRAEYEEARKADRTAQTFNQWVTDQQTQVVVAWVLSATFARFLEDWFMSTFGDPGRIRKIGRLALTPSTSRGPHTASTPQPN